MQKKRTMFRREEYNGRPVVQLQLGGQRRSFVQSFCVVCKKKYLAKVEYLRHGMGRACSRSCRGLLSHGLKERTYNHPHYKVIYLPSHHRARKQEPRKGFVFEHLVIAEKKIGRRIYRSEVVHHINGNKRDNRPQNLEVMPKRKHFALHARRGFSPCRFCGKI